MTLAALVATVVILVRGGGVGAIIPGAIVLTFGWSGYESVRHFAEEPSSTNYFAVIPRDLTGRA